MQNPTQVHSGVHLQGSPKEVGIEFCRLVLQPTATAIYRDRGAAALLEFMTTVLVHTGLDASMSFGQDVATIMLNAALRTVAEQDPCDSGERH